MLRLALQGDVVGSRVLAHQNELKATMPVERSWDAGCVSFCGKCPHYFPAYHLALFDKSLLLYATVNILFYLNI